MDAQTKAEVVQRETTTHSVEETIAFGRTLADLLTPPKLVLLRGDLGAGKTTLVKGIAAAFEAAAEEDVTSPTFTLVHEYRGPRANLYHIDLYRIDTPRELETLALDDLRSENSILLIEWGEKFAPLQRERDVEIALECQSENERRIRVTSYAMRSIRLFLLFFAICLVSPLFAQQPEWCKGLPRPAYGKLERVPTADSWFEVYKIRSGVFAIYEPHQLEEVISYLILGADRALLFDTGMGISNIQAVVAGLTKLPVSVLNSHTHNDHVGDNWRFADIYGMDTEFTRANSRGSKEDAQAELAPDEICGSLPAGFDAKAYATKPFHIIHSLHDGDQIDLGGRVLKVIGTPGHTPDSIALLDAKNGLLFTGDTFYAGPIYLYRPETDLDAYLASVQKLASLAPQLKLLLPAHNVPGASPSTLPKVVRAMQQARRGEVKPIAKDGKHEYMFEGFSFLMR